MTASQEKNNLHPRNRHRSRYDFGELIKSCPTLKPFVFTNDYGNQTINFSDPEAVKLLNQAILKNFYHVDYWDIPKNYLCPPIPGRADYIHYVADLLSESNAGKIPKTVRVLDIGTGANCVYPLIGTKEYGWSFIGSEVDPKAMESAKNIVHRNNLSIELRTQKSAANILLNVLRPDERIDLVLCNPPFHASLKDAKAGTERKLKNLGIKSRTKEHPVLNFGGQGGELWCPGGEFAFIQKMMDESVQFSKQCLWFTSLVSKGGHLVGLEKHLKKLKVPNIKVIEMSQGQKVSRLIAWSFMNNNEQIEWAKKYWKVV